MDNTSATIGVQQVNLLLAILIANGIGALSLVVLVFVVSGALKQLQQRLDRLAAEWEPRLIEIQTDLKKVQVEMLERLEASETTMALANQSMTQAQSVMAKADATLDDVGPRLQRMTADAELLVQQVRYGLAEFQQSVMPKLKTVSNVAGALREGLGIFQQLRNNRSQERR